MKKQYLLSKNYVILLKKFCYKTKKIIKSPIQGDVHLQSVSLNRAFLVAYKSDIFTKLNFFRPYYSAVSLCVFIERLFAATAV